MKAQYDINALEYVTRLHGTPRAAIPCPVDKETGKINPQATTFYYKKEAVTVVHVKPIYYETVNEKWRPMYEVCEHHGNRLVVFKYETLHKVNPRYIEWLRKRMVLIGGQVLVTSPFKVTPEKYGYTHEVVHSAISRTAAGLTVTTVYPDPDPETTSVDGRVGRQGASQTWDSLHDSTGTFATPTAASNLALYVDSTGTTGEYENMVRFISLFDASSIGDTDTIDSAIYSVYPSGAPFNNYAGHTPQVGVVSSNPASNTNLVNGDYLHTLFGTTDFATRVNVTAMTTGAYVDFTLNASGLANISKTTVSKFGMRMSMDIDDDGAAKWESQSEMAANLYQAENTGTANDPKLAVTHTAGALTVDMSEAITITEGVVKDIGLRTFSEGVTITDSVTNLIVKLKELAEGITITDSLGRAVGKVVNETVTITEVVKKTITKAWAETVTITASATALTATYTKIITESVVVTATIAKLAGYTRTFTESLSITDRLYGLLNGVNMTYVDTYTDTVDEYVDQYFNV